MVRCAFIGLGVMGGPMAAHLLAAGHEVVVFNRTASRAREWVQRHGGRAADSPAAAAAGAELVAVCVGNDADVDQVTREPGGVLETMEAGSILVDHTTASAELARRLYAAGAERGVGVLDAPVSGGQAGAENGTLTIMCGGDPEVFERADPLLAAYGRVRTLMGPAGSGQLTKMVNQICIAGLLQGLSEGLAFGRRAGLDLDRVLEVISAGAAGSWQMDNRGSTMVRDRFDFGFAVEWMVKDLGICLAEAERNGADLTVTELVAGYYAELVERGGARWDTSALIRRLS